MLIRIQILSTGEFLVLGSETVIPEELNTTIFNDQEDLLGSKSYSFTAPLQPNKAALRNAHLILTDAKLRKFKVRIWLGQNPWQIADLLSVATRMLSEASPAFPNPSNWRIPMMLQSKQFEMDFLLNARETMRITAGSRILVINLPKMIDNERPGQTI